MEKSERVVFYTRTRKEGSPASLVSSALKIRSLYAEFYSVPQPDDNTQSEQTKPDEDILGLRMRAIPGLDEMETVPAQMPIVIIGPVDADQIAIQKVNQKIKPENS